MRLQSYIPHSLVFPPGLCVHLSPPSLPASVLPHIPLITPQQWDGVVLSDMPRRTRPARPVPLTACHTRNTHTYARSAEPLWWQIVAGVLASDLQPRPLPRCYPPPTPTAAPTRAFEWAAWQFAAVLLSASISLSLSLSIPCLLALPLCC